MKSSLSLGGEDSEAKKESSQRKGDPEDAAAAVSSLLLSLSLFSFFQEEFLAAHVRFEVSFSLHPPCFLVR